MRVWPLALVCVGGCAQLFGLDETTNAPDANPDEVSLAVQRVSIGSTVVKSPQDMSGQMATFYVDDGTGTFTTTPGMLVPPNKLTAQIPMVTPAVQFTLPDDMTPYFFASSRAQIANNVVFERPGMMPAADTSQLHIIVDLPSGYIATEAVSVLALGPWTQHQLDPATELPAPGMGLTAIDATVNYVAGFSNLASSAMTRAKITTADYVLVLRTDGPKLTGYLETQFDQTDATDMISGTMVAVTPDRTVNATIDPSVFMTRFSMVQPMTAASFALGWSITAAPGASVGQTRGIQLAAGGSSMTDTMLTASYANPFEARWKSLLTYAATSLRSYTFMMAPVPLRATMETVSDPTTTSITLPAGLPTKVIANGTDLVTDGMDLPLDLTKPVTINATLEKPTATFYSLGIDEITVNGMVASRAPVLNAVSTSSSFKIPQSYFKVGHTYVLQFRTHEGGYPNAATGDFANVMLPYSSSTLDSALFTVAAP